MLQGSFSVGHKKSPTHFWTRHSAKEARHVSSQVIVLPLSTPTMTPSTSFVHSMAAFRQGLFLFPLKCHWHEEYVLLL